ncbi:DUF3034 family protein [Aquabacterium sp.]|uniref:DUF3034 family protein n=1 Tax=Aquabacterium sp. TaxID=1872578 RepID=UPI0037841EF4
MTFRPRTATARSLATACLLATASLAHAATDKLLLTGGVSTIDGAAGGGLSPWGVIGSNATEGQWGAAAYVSHARTQDYQLDAYGVALGFNDRVELSLARQDFDTGETGPALGIPGLTLKQDIVGAKLRLAGDAVLDSDTLMPQIAAGMLVKRVDAGGLAPTLDALGARRHGVDLYLSATKLFLAQGVLVNATLRASKANQGGLLGYGGTAHSRWQLLPEVSVAYLVNRTLAVGAEYRVKPDNLNPSLLGAGLKEDDWADVFIAWAPSKHFSLTAAYVDLGRIVPGVKNRRQTGAYLSAQIAF